MQTTVCLIRIGPFLFVLQLARTIHEVETSWALGATFHYIESVKRHWDFYCENLHNINILNVLGRTWTSWRSPDSSWPHTASKPRPPKLYGGWHLLVKSSLWLKPHIGWFEVMSLCQGLSLMLRNEDAFMLTHHHLMPKTCQNRCSSTCSSPAGVRIHIHTSYLTVQSDAPLVPPASLTGGLLLFG